MIFIGNKVKKAKLDVLREHEAPQKPGLDQTDFWKVLSQCPSVALGGSPYLSDASLCHLKSRNSYGPTHLAG